MDISTKSNLDTSIKTELDEQVDLALTIHTLLDQDLLKVLIKEHKYDISLRRLTMAKLPKGVNREEVINHFKNKHLHTINTFYYNMIYDFTELGIIDNEETNINKAVKPIEKLITEINELIDNDAQRRNTEIQKWAKLKQNVYDEYEDAQCSRKLRLRKITSIIKEVNSEITYINKILLKFNYKKAPKLAKQVYNFFYHHFGIDLYNESNPLNDNICDLPICFRKSIDKEIFEFIVYYLELFVKYYSNLLDIAKREKCKNAYELFNLDYKEIRKEFYDSLIPTFENTKINKDGFVVSEDYIKYFSYDFGKLLAVLEENTGVVVRYYITKEIKRRQRIDKFVQVAPNVFSYGLFAFMLWILYVYEFTLLKYMSGRLAMLICYCLLFVTFIFCNVNLIRNTIQFKRPKRARYQKRSFAVILIFALITGGIEAYLVNRYDGYDDNVYYCFNGENTVVVEDVRNKGIVDYTIPSKVNSEVCPGITGEYTVTEINSRTFYDITSLKNVVVSETVEVIGNSAFEKCENLESVTLPSSLNVISKKMFKDCERLTTINGPTSIEEIKDESFANCGSLINYPYFDSARYIGKKAFINCIQLLEVEFSDKITRIEKRAFENCGMLHTLSIPNDPEFIGKDIFKDCDDIEIVTVSTDKYHLDEYFSKETKSGITNVTITSGTKIPANYFKDAENLKEVIIPDSINVIEENAFYNCISLDNIILPDGITKIKENAFANCWSLSSIDIPANITEILSSTFQNCESLSSVNLPEGLVKISNNAFQNCINLGVISLPSTLTLVENEAFYNCSKLNVQSLPVNLKTVGDRAFFGCGNCQFDSFENLANIGSEAFFNCLQIESLILSNELKTIGSNAFGECYHINYLNINYDNIENVTRLIEIIHVDNISSIVINSLEQMPNYFFEACYKLKNISFENCELKEIKEGVFKNCASLKSIDLTNPNYISIGKYAFYGCENLKEVVFGDNIETIGDNAFENCTLLRRIVLGKNTKVVGNSVFQNCVNLTDITFGEKTETIGANSFNNCDSLITVKFTPSIKTIGTSAFANCDVLMYVSIPGTVENINEKAFYDCPTLHTISIDYKNMNQVSTLDKLFTMNYINEIEFVNLSLIPNNFMENASNVNKVTFTSSDVTSVGEKAFSGCMSLTEIDFSSTSLETISKKAFYDCDNLRTINFGEKLKSIGEEAFCGCRSMDTLNLPNSLENIGKKAFYGARSITLVTLPLSLKEVGKEAFSTQSTNLIVKMPIIEKSAEYIFGFSTGNITMLSVYGSSEVTKKYFKGLESLALVTLEDSVKKISDSAFENCHSLKAINLEQIEVIGKKAFMNCSELQNIVLGQSIEKIEASSFEKCTSISEIVIPESLKEISKRAFYGCSELSNIIIPTSVEKIGTHAFGECINLTSAKYKILEKKGLFSSYQTFENIFGIRCTNLSNITIVDTVEIPNNYFMGITSIEKVTLGEEVETIGKNAFKNCSSLVEVNLFNTKITSVSNSCFQNCRELTTISLNSKLETIGKNAFKNCTNLSNVNFEVSNLVEIGNSAFESTNLTFVNAPATLERIGNKAFKNCYELQNVILGQDVVEIGSSSFEGCTAINEFIIPESVKEIGKRAFYGCSNLIKVSIPTGVEKIGTHAFGDCINLISATYKILSKKGLFVSYQSFENIFGIRCYSLENIKIIGTTEIPHYYFMGVASIKKVTLGEEVESLGRNAFKDCTALNEVNLFNTKITEIPKNCFQNCRELTTINLNSKLEVIMKNAFKDCTNLTNVNFEGTSLVEIGDNAFEGTNIDYIDAPATLERIGKKAFYECYSLSSAHFFNTKLTVIPEKAFGFCNELVGITFPDSLELIEAYAFDSCNQLSAVELSHTGLVSIEKGGFHYCNLLEVVNLPESLETLGDEAFAYCGKLYRINLDDTKVSVIPKKCFKEGYQIGNILYEGLEEIKSNSFENCGRVEVLSIPSTVKKIGSKAFGFEMIVTLEIDLNNQEIWDKKINKYFSDNGSNIHTVRLVEGSEIYDNMFNYLDVSTFEFNTKIERIGKHAFAYSNIRSIELQDSLKEIGFAAFRGCYNLSKVDITSLESYMNIDFASINSNPLYKAHKLYLYNVELDTIELHNVANVKKYQFAGLDCRFVDISNVDTIERSAFKDAQIDTIIFDGTPEELESICKDKTILDGYVHYLGSE